MDPEIKDMIRKNLELSAENNKMLHSIKRGIFWGKIMRIVYWVIILGIGVGLYYYVEPYIDGAVGAYGNVKGDLQSFKDVFTK